MSNKPQILSDRDYPELVLLQESNYVNEVYKKPLEKLHKQGYFTKFESFRDFRDFLLDPEVEKPKKIQALESMRGLIKEEDISSEEDVSSEEYALLEETLPSLCKIIDRSEPEQLQEVIRQKARGIIPAIVEKNTEHFNNKFDFSWIDKKYFLDTLLELSEEKNDFSYFSEIDINYIFEYILHISEAKKRFNLLENILQKKDKRFTIVFSWLFNYSQYFKIILPDDEKSWQTFLIPFLKACFKNKALIPIDTWVILKDLFKIAEEDNDFSYFSAIDMDEVFTFLRENITGDQERLEVFKKIMEKKWKPTKPHDKEKFSLFINSFNDKAVLNKLLLLLCDLFYSEERGIWFDIDTLWINIEILDKDLDESISGLKKKVGE